MLVCCFQAAQHTSERRRTAYTLVVAGVSRALSAGEQFAGLGLEEYPRGPHSP